MRNATSREPLKGLPADLQTARRGCADLGPQVEHIAEQLAAALRQASQELHRLETQRDELRRSARDTPPPVMPRLLERIEEQGQCVQRLERAHQGLQELRAALGSVGEHLERGLEQQSVDRHEHEAILREEKRMWLRELLSLRQRLEGAESAAERPRAGNEDLARLRAEKERLAQRVTELERDVSARDETLLAKEQTLADLRKMVSLLTPAPPAPPAAPPLAERPPAVPEPSARPRSAPTPTEQLFGNSTMQLAQHLLESLGTEDVEEAMPAPPPPPPKPERRATSREIRFGPLDEFTVGPPSLPPPVPSMSPLVPGMPPPPPPVMPRASARVPSATRTPSTITPTVPLMERPGTLVISEDMFNDVLAEQDEPGSTGRK
ncbi:hypothetical protein D187_009588 [Cystobacter fuscus DSM 2262]|uniref:Uncharacterized protein n=2 Tax=Cystobacter fuscus TaxID=43 RepID=S9NYK3_CYSF2|nr:hypothetical protein D187_009588 [Cystobacter fuscus DSM 2262]